MSFYWKGFHKPFVHFLLIFFFFSFGYISQVIHLFAAHILMSSLWEHGLLSYQCRSFRVKAPSSFAACDKQIHLSSVSYLLTCGFCYSKILSSPLSSGSPIAWLVCLTINLHLWKITTTEILTDAICSSLAHSFLL